MPDPLLAQPFLVRHQRQRDEIRSVDHALVKLVLNFFHEISEDGARLHGGRSHARANEIPR